MENETKDMSSQEVVEMRDEKKQNKDRIKNLVALVIFLSGLFVGSLFVDVAQLVRREGFSVKKLGQSDIFEANGKTWVAYGEPAVSAKIISAKDCEQCVVDEILVWLRRVVPTVAMEKIEFDSTQGKELVAKFNIKTLPAFVFAKELEKTEFHSQAAVIFEEKENEYLLKTQEIGIPIGMYLETPQINEGDALSGSKNAKVKVVVFGDFQCPYSKIFYQSLEEAMKNFQTSDVVFAFKHLPLSIHLQAENAALSSECALEQGKFWEYASLLYENQTAWADTETVSKFKEYARTTGLDRARFDQCLDSKRYQGKIEKDIQEATNFSISGTPGVFINKQFQEGIISQEQLKTAIETELGK